MSAELTELGNMALRNLISSLTKLTAPDAWDSAYARGQLNTISGYMDPDPALLKQAERAVDEIVKARVQHELAQISK